MGLLVVGFILSLSEVDYPISGSAFAHASCHVNIVLGKCSQGYLHS